jgi:hypothetical protein
MIKLNFILFYFIIFLELTLLFKLMDRVPDGILKMLKDLEDYIVSAGLADMMASADIITQVKFVFSLKCSMAIIINVIVYHLF